MMTPKTAGLLFLIVGTGCGRIDHGDPHWLDGSWTAPAFSGRLDEEWSSTDGWRLHKKGFYIEGNDTLYAEEVRVDSMFGGLYLTAQPRGGDPVIFRMTAQAADSMVFENAGNRNPFRVVYRRLDERRFTRITTGHSGTDTVINRFSFERQAR